MALSSMCYSWECNIWLSHHNGNIGRAESYRGVKIRDHNDIIYVSLQIFRIEIVSVSGS